MARLGKIGYFTPKEAADFLGIRLRTFHYWKERGLIPEPVLNQKRLLAWHKSQIEEVLKTKGGVPYNGNPPPDDVL